MESYKPFKPTFQSATAADSVNSLRTEPIPEGFIGFLEVFIQHARDINNICIYHKQDVYAKICLTGDPDAAVSTKIINGGGRNPVFDETLRLNVRTAECSLKCELWMLSRVKNYLEDQLLGFALVPLSDVLMADGKLAQEFSLSSTDLFHSPAGFVQLSLSYVGASPDVMAITAPTKPVRSTEVTLPDAEVEDSIPSEYQKIEFPDLKVVKENQLMVSEYFGIPCPPNMEAQSSDSLITSENGDESHDEEAGMRIVEGFSAANSLDSSLNTMKDTPASSISTTESPGVLPATSQSVSGPLWPAASASPKDKSSEGEADSSSRPSENASSSMNPLISINMEPEHTVIQQDIVDMYMKSMQQFTESLAKMKLPMDMEKSSANAENGEASSEKKLPASKGNGGPRVFYGSRAFF